MTTPCDEIIEQSASNVGAGGNLIFLISQPRSGSSLLQHILGSHSQVHTLPEPWFMLHLVYALRSSGLEAEYNARYAYLALGEFLEGIPDGEADYIDAVRDMALSLYEKALESSGKEYLLDKTPRYYLIVPELRRIFPRAKFILLLRNPLAVLSSILEVNLGGNWTGLFRIDRKHDILSAPRLILEGIERLGDQAAVVHYEQLVVEPEQTIGDLCQRIGLRFEPAMLRYGGKVRFEGTTFVDSKSIYKHEGPVTDYLEGWLTRFDTPQKTHLAKAYLVELGRDTVSGLGYSYDDLMVRLGSLRSNGRQFVVPWHLLVTPPAELRWWSRLRLALLKSNLKHGVWGTFRRYVWYVLRGS